MHTRSQQVLEFSRNVSECPILGDDDRLRVALDRRSTRYLAEALTLHRAFEALPPSLQAVAFDLADSGLPSVTRHRQLRECAVALLSRKAWMAA